MISTQPLIVRLSSLLTRPFFLSLPGCCSDEEGWPGQTFMSPPVAMATPYFPTFLLLLFLSSFTLLLLTLLPSVAPSIPFSSSSPRSPRRSHSCGLGQSWAVRLHAGPRHEKEDAEQSSMHMDVIADRVQYLINPFCSIECQYLNFPKAQAPISLF